MCTSFRSKNYAKIELFGEEFYYFWCSTGKTIVKYTYFLELLVKYCCARFILQEFIKSDCFSDYEKTTLYKGLFYLQNINTRSVCDCEAASHIMNLIMTAVTTTSTVETAAIAVAIISE